MGWTAPRTWADSEVPNAATMNAHIPDNVNALRWSFAYNPTDVSMSSPTTPLFDHPELHIPVGTNEVWLFQASILITGIQGMSITWKGPPSSSGSFTQMSMVDSAGWAGAGARETALGTTAGPVYGGTVVIACIATTGTLITTVPGELQFAFAPYVVDVPVAVKQGSWLIAQRLA